MNPPRLLLLGCYRRENERTSSFLRALAEARALVQGAVAWHELAVDPLSPGEAADLALCLLGRVDAHTTALAGTVARESGGNPFFIQELVHQLRPGQDADRPPAPLPCFLFVTFCDLLWPCPSPGATPKPARRATIGRVRELVPPSASLRPESIPDPTGARRK